MTVLLASLIDETKGLRLAKITAPTWRELCFQMESLIVAAHAAHPKSQLKFHIDGQRDLPNSKQLHVKCLQPGCVGIKAPELRTDVPLELIGAMTLMFHTAHEGHRLEITYDGVTWKSPFHRPDITTEPAPVVPRAPRRRQR